MELHYIFVLSAVRMLALYDPSVPFSLLALIFFNLNNLIVEVVVTFAPCLRIANNLFQYTFGI